jgi:hypothetical protein
MSEPVRRGDVFMANLDPTSHFLRLIEQAIRNSLDM